LDDSLYVLNDAEIVELRLRWERRDYSRIAVRAGVAIPVRETASRFPDPLWLPTMGLAPVVAVSSLLPHDRRREQLRPTLREILASNIQEDPIWLPACVGRIIVDSLYFDHLYQIDAVTGRDRIDADHVNYAPLIPSTLQYPLEVYHQQEGGAKTRKSVFLKLYVIDSSYVYHIVVLARDKRLLTSYRLAGGRSAFLAHRFGVPLYANY